MGIEVYSALLAVALFVASPWWLFRVLFGPGFRAGLRQRLGSVPEGVRVAVAGRRVIWLHAVSVGEVLAAARLVEELEAALGPGFVVAVSTTTVTGQSIAQTRLPGHPLFYLPLDFAFAVRRWMRALQPELLLLVESELWPRLLDECRRTGVPVAVVNARISDRSFRRARRVSPLWRLVARNVTLFLPQGEESASRLRALGVSAEHIVTTGNLKYDAPTLPPNPLVDALRNALATGTSAAAELLVCGSTLAGEEGIILDAWPTIQRLRPHARLLLAPRHPRRFDAVAQLIIAHGLPLQRLSEWKHDAETPASLPPDTILLLDSLGSLAAVYALASVAFVGGSLVEGGGHNPLEPARFGVPVLMGESVGNFREMVAAMLAAHAIRLLPAARFAEGVTAMLFDGGAMGERGRAFFRSQSGATARTVAALLPLLHPQASATPETAKQEMH